ncbi:two pore domain potassium channel family protein [Nonomuraea deserti]|uniref:Two pore domain potassium channel family protein n=1 Tax=Nonomuraea deserti TaxID=1848322 RepID=A0A4R4VM02_9ACTN|nr:potassium channel family protein [Nonomuraea deserti]TDD06799.1 two pore domain potassium channel family protein [Nonomuraea deserti]
MDRLTSWERRTSTALLTIGTAFLLSWAIPIVLPGLPPVVDQGFWYLQVCTYLLFTADYLIRVYLAPRRTRFVLRNIPSLLVVLLPLLRPLWLLRALLLLQIVAERIQLPLRLRAVVYVSGTAVFLALVGSIAVLGAERDNPASNIQTIGDALWWSLTTMTTVGYGDRFPVTAEGRLVASGLMLAGIALLGVVTAAIASWFVERFERNAARERRTEADVAQILSEINELRGAVDELAGLRTVLAGIGDDQARLHDRLDALTTRLAR